MRYEIIFVDEKKYVMFYWKHNGNDMHMRVPVMVNAEGKEYVHVPNFLSDDLVPLYIGRIKDAVDTIRNGLGDCILREESNISFLNCDHVIMFLDREYGDRIKKMSIEGWKNAEFGYSIEAGYHNSFSGPRRVDENGNYCTRLFEEPTPPIFYSSKEETSEKINKWIKEANDIYEKYESIADDDTKKDYLHSISLSDVMMGLLIGIENKKKQSDNSFDLVIIQAVKEK